MVMKRLDTCREVEFGKLYLVHESGDAYYYIFDRTGTDTSLERDHEHAYMGERIHWAGAYEPENHQPWEDSEGRWVWASPPVGFNDSFGTKFYLIETVEDIPDPSAVQPLQDNGMLDHMKKGIKRMRMEEIWKDH